MRREEWAPVARTETMAVPEDAVHVPVLVAVAVNGSDTVNLMLVTERTGTSTDSMEVGVSNAEVEMCEKVKDTSTAWLKTVIIGGIWNAWLGALTGEPFRRIVSCMSREGDTVACGRTIGHFRVHIVSSVLEAYINNELSSGTSRDKVRVAFSMS
jgi:hypothetical protein